MRVEIRADSVHIEGYVNAVDRDSRPIPSPKGRFIERIRPKTFEKSLKRSPNVELRFNHRQDRVLGSTGTGELTLYEDNIGLRAKCIVTDPEVMEKARKKELRGWSFGFCVNKDKWEDAENGMQRRYLEDIDLSEVSILDRTPAYVATSIEQRGDDESVIEKRSIEDVSEVIDAGEKVKEKEQEKRDLLSVQKCEAEYLKMKGGFYNGENF